MSKTKLYYAATFLAGLLLGWLLIGWWLWPVAYVGEAYTYELNQADKLRYASAVVDSYAATGIADPAWFAQWTPEEVSQVMEQVAKRNPARANLARVLANQASAQPVQVKAQNQVSEAGLPDWFIYAVFAVLGIALACGGLWVGYSAKRTKANSPNFEWVPNPHILPTVPGEFQGLRQAVKAAREIAHAQLTFGPDNPTDQHFPIESQQEGEPSPGEFGVNQVEDQPAWDVWLFDKQALVTVTKVLAEQRNEELASRGELIEWKKPFTLETANLKMTGMAHKELEGNLIVELVVEAKDEN